MTIFHQGRTYVNKHGVRIKLERVEADRVKATILSHPQTILIGTPAIYMKRELIQFGYKEI